MYEAAMPAGHGFILRAARSPPRVASTAAGTTAAHVVDDALLRLVADGPDGVLGGLPLALVCAAGSLCARRETFSQFYSAARFSLARAVRTASAVVPGSVSCGASGWQLEPHRLALQAVWWLTQQELSAAARDLMRALVYFHPDCTLEEVFVWAARDDGCTASLPRLHNALHLADGMEDRRNAVRRLADELVAVSLATRVVHDATELIPGWCFASRSPRSPSTAAADAYVGLAVHRVVQDVIRGKRAPTGRTATPAMAALSFALACSDGGMVDVDAATYSSRALGSGNAVVQWIAARHALACMRWLLPEQLARVGGDVVKWCLARPAKLARVLAQVCQLADSVTMCEMALRVGEVCGLWETKEWRGNRSRKTVGT